MPDAKGRPTAEEWLAGLESVEDKMPNDPVCKECGLRKKPIGRDAAPAVANSLCDHECPGYYKDPCPAYRWPGEPNA